MKLSIIIPIYNEEDNIEELYKELKLVVTRLIGGYEIIAVNDGSRDKSLEILKEIAKKDYNFRIIDFKKNFGQTAAIAAGVEFSRGEIIIPMDADLQNDPADIPKFLEEINKGFDVVSGWRKERRDKLLTRIIPSKIANSLISFVAKIKLHDYGCTMKAYRKEIIKDIKFYGEMHRLIPAYASCYGAKISELVVNHRARKHGRTKYGISRTFRVFLDLLTVKFLIDYSTKPMHFFGKVGYWSLFFGFLSGILALILRLFFGISLILTPLPLLTVFLILVGVQFILMGLLAEIIMRDYYESQHKPTYLIKERINFEN